MNLKYILLNESNRPKRLHALFNLYDILKIAKLYRKIIDQFFCPRLERGGQLTPEGAYEEMS